MMRVDLRDQLAGLNDNIGAPPPNRGAAFFLAAIAAIASLSACYLWFSYSRPIELDSKAIAAADHSMMVDLRASQEALAVSPPAALRRWPPTR